MAGDEFLAQLEAADREELEASLVTRRYGPGEIIIGQTDEGNDVFFVLEGLAQATVYSEEGKAVAYRDIGEGAIFGELSAIDGAPRSATVSALTAVRAGRLRNSQFRRLTETNPAFTWALLRYFSMQARRMTERIFEFSTMPVRDRLVHELVRLAEPHVRADGSAELRPAPTHSALATRISTHREAVSREISQFTKMGLLSKKDGRLLIRDVCRLRGMTGRTDFTLKS